MEKDIKEANESIMHNMDIDLLTERLMQELDHGRYIIMLQPKYDLANNIVEAEALIRYKAATDIVSPAVFIPFFERARLISKIDLYVFSVICESIYKWQEEKLQIVPISVNFSRETLMMDDLLLQMEKIRKRYKVKTEYLFIEITESAFCNRIRENKILKQLNDHGYQLQLDDFGVAYSNLRSFVDYPFTTIKIDKGLITDIETNWKDRVLIEHIINLCHICGNKVVAEGVENKYQYEFLKEKDCDMVQGFYLDGPLTLERFEKKYMRRS